MEVKKKQTNKEVVAFLTDLLERSAEEKSKRDAELASGVDARAWGAQQHSSRVAWLLAAFQIVLILLFACVATGAIGEGNETSKAITGSPGSETQAYNMFIGVEIMMFVGFGYLMTFLKWYGLGAVGFTMIVTAMGLQWSLFTESFFDQAMNSAHAWHEVHINMYALLNALYAISAVLITFGALIGKISPLQLVLVTIIELFCHSVNFKVLMGALNVQDMGGTYVDHMFGAYFGLSVAWVLGKPKSEPSMGNTPDVFSLIGTVFLWIYWPSFVAGAANADSEQQGRALVNTILSLAASTVCTFIFSSFLGSTGQFRPVDIQNATLAGGVAIGCTANLSMSPFGAIMIGCTAGIVSTWGYNRLMPWLEENFGLHDTCGIHNLHAMPSVVGALASVILAGYKDNNGQHDANIYGYSVNGSGITYTQWWRQLVGIFVCIAFAVSTGGLVGVFLKYVQPVAADVKEFHDDQWWTVADDYNKTFYSELGIIIGNAGPGSEWSSHRGPSADAQGSRLNELDNSSHHGRRRMQAQNASIPRKPSKSELLADDATAPDKV